MESDQLIMESPQDMIKEWEKGFDTGSFKTVTEKKKIVSTYYSTKLIILKKEKVT